MKLPTDKIVYGVDTYFNPIENANIRSLLKIPFQKNKSPKKVDV